MSKQLTEEHLRKEMERIERDNDIAALRARVAQLEAALKEMHQLALRDGMRWGPAIADAEALLKDAPQ